MLGHCADQLANNYLHLPKQIMSNIYCVLVGFSWLWFSANRCANVQDIPDTLVQYQILFANV